MLDRDLLADLQRLRAHHEFTRDRIGQEGCAVRVQAAKYVETIDRAMASAPQLLEAMQCAKVLIGARNDDLSEAARQSNINEAWHILDAALKAITLPDTMQAGDRYE